MRNPADSLTGTLRLGVYQPMSVFRTPQLLREFHKVHPDVEVDIQEGSQERLVELLKGNFVDVVVSYSLIDFAQWEVETLTKIPPHAIVSTRHPLANKTSVTLQEIAQEPLVLLDLPYTGAYYLGLFEAQGLSPEVAYRIEGYETVRSMVAEGFGVSVLSHRPQHNKTYVGDGVHVLELEGTNQPVAVQLVRHPQSAESSLVKEFAAVAYHVFRGRPTRE
ncbi:MAG TPA: LysR substrate-binding domain-containing protein [Yaniella sp.]